MEDESYIKITYGGREFYLTADDESSQVVARIESALKVGGTVTFDHNAGRTAIGLGNGTPVTIDYLNPIQPLGL